MMAVYPAGLKRVQIFGEESIKSLAFEMTTAKQSRHKTSILEGVNIFIQSS